MRNNELTEGIEVIDHDNNVVGTSKIAAKQVSDVMYSPSFTLDFQTVQSSKPHCLKSAKFLEYSYLISV